MRSIQLGDTDLQVSRVCFGTWQLSGSWGVVDTDEAVQAIHRALELGVNFFDTAAAYGWGASESLLGEALRTVLRDHRQEIVLASKGGLSVVDGVLCRDSSERTLRLGLEASLQALGTDYLDVFLVHWPDQTIPFVETTEVLQGFVAAGLARYVGFSNADTDLVTSLGAGRGSDIVQSPFSLLRRAASADLLPACSARGVGVMTYGPLAHGLLAGRLASLGPGDWRSESHVFKGPEWEEVQEVVPRLAAIAKAAGMTLPHLAIGWTLSHPAVHSTIVGVRRPAHIEQAATAPLDGLSAEVLHAIDQVLLGVPDLDVASPENF